jgi:hypothetical protein
VVQRISVMDGSTAVGAGAREGDRGQRVDQLGADRHRQARRCRRWRGGHGRGGVVGGHLGQGASPPGHAPAGEHGKTERERFGTGVQRGVAKRFVAGVQPATVAITLVHRGLLTG